MAEQTATNNTRGRLNQVIGEVISDKMDKTISVKIFRQVKHKKYGKYLRKSSVFKAHDETNMAKTGDKVLITESRPMSKTKRWKLAKVLEASAE
ncbi:MAG: 30S ribosomal protein S17 [Bdellovibrionales bacterium]